ncbi:hypothetical protein [Streptomyces phaeoluteigriseus]
MMRASSGAVAKAVSSPSPAARQQVTNGAGKVRADARAARVPKRAWQKLSPEPGAKGHRFYHWAVTYLPDGRLGHHQMLIRSDRATGGLFCYR